MLCKDVYQKSEILRKVANSRLAEEPNSSPDPPPSLNPSHSNDIFEPVVVDSEDDQLDSVSHRSSFKSPAPTVIDNPYEQTGLAIEVSPYAEELSPAPSVHIGQDILSPDELEPLFKSPEIPLSALADIHEPISTPQVHTDTSDPTFSKTADEFDEDLTLSENSHGISLSALNKTYHHISLHNTSHTQPTDIFDLVEFNPF
jgi:hypothetical protein